MSCATCRFTTRCWIAFDDQRDFCGHPSARINGEPVGFVSGEEANLCDCYEQGYPTVEDELITVSSPLIDLPTPLGLRSVGN